MRASITAFLKNALTKIKTLCARTQTWIKKTTRSATTWFVASVNRPPHDYVDPQAPIRTTKGTCCLKVYTDHGEVNLETSSVINTSGATYSLYATKGIENWTIPASGDLNGIIAALIELAKLDTYGIAWMTIGSHHVRLSISSAVPLERIQELAVQASRLAGLAYTGVVVQKENTKARSIGDMDSSVVRLLGFTALMAGAREKPYSSSASHPYDDEMAPKG